MRIWILFLALSVVAACGGDKESLVQATEPAPVVDTAEVQPILIGYTHILRSETLGDAREINVWLPPGYDADEQSYGVVYVLDGALDQDFQHIAGLGHLGALSWTYEALIIVGVETKTRMAELTATPQDQRYQDEFPEAGDADMFRQFLGAEVIPFIEATYRTGDRKAIMGESLAGLFVADTFFKSPDLFDDYIAISPSLWWDDRALGRDAIDLLGQHGASGRRLYLTMADEGGTMQDGLDRVVAGLEAAAPEGLKWTYIDRRETDTHSTIYHGAALDAFRWLYAMPPYDYGTMPWYLVDSAAP